LRNNTAVGCVAIIAKPFEIHVFLTQVVAVLAQAAQHGRQRAIGTVWEVVAVLAQAAQHGRQRAIGTVWEAEGG